MELMQANKQWSKRPDDERFTSLHALRDSVTESRMSSRATVAPVKVLNFQPSESDAFGLEIVGPKGNAVTATNWSFGQVANRLGAPAAYLRTLPAALVADQLNYKAQFDKDSEELGLLFGMEDGLPSTLRAATGPKYGRVWNQAIADSLVNLFGDGVTGQWKVPGFFGNALDKVTKENTTIYGSDRDCFVFLADEENRVELPNRRNGKTGSLARGVFVWNSEVGSTSFGMAAFLFDYVCCNRIVWGATEYKESRFRHTATAPEKWLDHVAPVIAAYSKYSGHAYEQALIAAQNKKVDDVSAFLMKRFSKKAAHAMMAAHMDEENRPMESLWDISTGITAYAKGIPFQNDRVAIEREAGKVLDLAA